MSIRCERGNTGIVYGAECDEPGCPARAPTRRAAGGSNKSRAMAKQHAETAAKSAGWSVSGGVTICATCTAKMTLQWVAGQETRL